MKNKIKKWHIAFMSFLTLFIAVFASIFSLQADTVDEEITINESINDWELGVVFYDSTVDSGKTPLTEINWDASDGSYKEGTPRVITVQINYKNSNVMTTYQPGELEISIPNLVYNSQYDSKGTQWGTSILVGANDKNHTGYDWNLTNTHLSWGYASINDIKHYFSNAKEITAGTNIEGSIQIQYTITPLAETFEGYSYLGDTLRQIEKYENECTHNYYISLQAFLKPKNTKITVGIKENTIEHTITSPNWPEKYNLNMSKDQYYWEYTSPTLENLALQFDSTSTLHYKDFIYIYDQNGKELYKLTTNEMAGRTYFIKGNYVKIAMSSDDYYATKGFSVNIGEYSTVLPEGTAMSNIIDFTYTRNYIHPWIEPPYTLEKTASKISSYDLLPNANEYIWVKYSFKALDEIYSSLKYPYVPSDLYLIDTFPAECRVLDDNFISLEGTTTDNSITYQIPCDRSRYNGVCKTIYVGYPKNIYNSENNNLLITNYAELYGMYETKTSYELFATDEVSLNLNDFEFSYSGTLYGLIKKFSSEDLYYESLVGTDIQIGSKGEVFAGLFPTARYTGQLMDVRIGDDLMYITDENGNYRKLNDTEFYFNNIEVYGQWIKNGQGLQIEPEKYNCELWVRYENESEYVLYEEFLNPDYSKNWDFTADDNIVGYYIVFKNMEESIITSGNYAAFRATATINDAVNIAETGTIHNFAYIQVYIDSILQNEPSIDSYANLITQEEIANFDQETYGTYMQRHSGFVNYKKYEAKIMNYVEVSNYIDTITQDAENEQFVSSCRLDFCFDNNDLYTTRTEIFNYISQIPAEQKFVGFELYCLLPEGMVLKSSADEILNSLYLHSSWSGNKVFTYDDTAKQLTADEVLNLIKDNQEISIINNYNNTNRTYIYIKSAFENYPLSISSYEAYGPRIFYEFDFSIPYDSYLEFGNMWQIRIYGNPYNRELGGSGFTACDFVSSFEISDNGKYDIQETDINNNNNTEEPILYSYSSKTINSVVSTHQDVTTYVKTDQSNFSTGIVDSSCDSGYEYKLRVRTGAAEVTNLVIYTSIEEAQPNLSRWYGEFLGIDTTYAENKGYTVKVWYSPNKTVGTLAEDTSWQVYDEATVDKSKVKSLAFQYLVETDDTTGTNMDAIDPAVLPANSLTYVLIKMKSPADENETRLAHMDCWTQWNAIDEFDRPVDFIIGINSNVVKVALPNSINEDSNPSISLKFTKETQGTDSEFKNMKLDKAAQQTFMIKLTNLTANEDGSYNQLTALLKSNQELIISQIPIGTYLLEELENNYFNFVDFTDNNDPENIINGVTFERTNQGYIITVSEDLAETVEFNIKVTNEIEPERFYEDKDNKENLFLKNKIEEDA